MEIEVTTKYDIGDKVIVDKSFNGQVMGIRVSISHPTEANKNILLIDKTYLIEVNDEIIEADENILIRKNIEQR